MRIAGWSEPAISQKITNQELIIIAKALKLQKKMGKRTRYFEQFRYEQGVILTKELHLDGPTSAHNMEEVIAIKGTIPRVGDRVKLRRYNAVKNHIATITRASPDGIPVQVKLDDGKIIEVVGYLLQLIGLFQKIWAALEELFRKPHNQIATSQSFLFNKILFMRNPLFKLLVVVALALSCTKQETAHYYRIDGVTLGLDSIENLVVNQHNIRLETMGEKLYSKVVLLENDMDLQFANIQNTRVYRIAFNPIDTAFFLVHDRWDDKNKRWRPSISNQSFKSLEEIKNGASGFFCKTDDCLAFFSGKTY